MKKQVNTKKVALNESTLRKIVRECVKKMVSESICPDGMYTIFVSAEDGDTFVYVNGQFYHVPNDMQVNPYNDDIMGMIEDGSIPMFDTEEEADGMTQDDFYQWLRYHNYRPADFECNGGM